MSKRTRRTRKDRKENRFENQQQVIDFQTFKQHNKKVVILPKNIAQEDYLALLNDDAKNIIFATGPAGTGKTLLAVLSAIKALKARECSKIVITRPAVSVDEQHGFLPGTLVEKMAPWTRPIFDVFEEYYSMSDISAMIDDGVVEVAPLAYMRGRTFKNAWIIFDEAQNCTSGQMEMALTRIGDNAKMIITGDLYQHDRGYESNGLKQFLELLADYDGHKMGAVSFARSDVERHPVVSEVLALYNHA